MHFKFLHAADLHIDSPLLGLERYDDAPVDEIRLATRRACENLVALAIDERVAIVLIAGDLFDGDWKDMNTPLWMAGQFRRLQAENIRVVMLRGNHDAASGVRSGRRAFRWPENVHELSTKKPETVRFDDLGVAVHGQGFATRDVRENLAAAYPEAIPGLLNIGLLHASVEGESSRRNDRHEPYAPASLDDLRGRRYDYWALGHIHQREILCDDPYVVYSGNTQGRHIREPGERGCYLVEVEDGHIVGAPAFRATDVFRWTEVEISLEPDDGFDVVYDRAAAAIQAAQTSGDGVPLAVRATLTGSCRAHAELSTTVGQERVDAELRNVAGEFPDVWIEKVRIRTTPTIDLESLKASGDLLGDLLRSVDAYKSGSDARKPLIDAIAPLRTRAAAELADLEGFDVDANSEEQLLAWIRDAESLLLSHLLEGDA